MNIQKGKILKTSKILGVLLKIGGVVLAMTMVLLIVFAIIAPSLDLESANEVIDVWDVSVPLDGSVDNFRALMMVTLLGSGIMVAILFVASSIFKDIGREGAPFTKENSNKIRVISLLLIAQYIVIPPLQFLAVMIFSPTTSPSVSLNLGAIIIVGIFYCLALIFEYGVELQRQSDETL
jgi:hypothetical protein